MARTIDPIRLAQFMVLPGAGELIEAFAALPPGAIRDSAVSHVQVLAQAYATGPFQPEPTRMAEPRPLRLESPFAVDLKAESPEGQIVERLLRGERPDQVADDLGLGLGLITGIMGRARREGGVVFPGDAERKPAKAKAGKRKQRKPHRFPIPPPPYWWEDPSSPHWESSTGLPSLADDAKGSIAAIGPNDRRTYSVMLRAAERRGMTLRQYIALRYEIVRRVEAGESITPLAMDIRVVPQDIYGLLSAIGRGRMSVALEASRKAVDGPEPLPGPEDRPEPQGAPRGSLGPARPIAPYRLASGLSARMAAAKLWGFADVEAFEAARVEVREMRLSGYGPGLIEQKLGQPGGFVKAALEFWHGEGVRFPGIKLKAPRKRGAA